MIKTTKIRKIKTSTYTKARDFYFLKDIVTGNFYTGQNNQISDFKSAAVYYSKKSAVSHIKGIISSWKHVLKYKKEFEQTNEPWPNDSVAERKDLDNWGVVVVEGSVEIINKMNKNKHVISDNQYEYVIARILKDLSKPNNWILYGDSLKKVDGKTSYCVMVNDSEMIAWIPGASDLIALEEQREIYNVAKDVINNKHAAAALVALQTQKRHLCELFHIKLSPD